MTYAELAALFTNPPAAYRPMIFWLWNGEITAAGIREQVADFAARGCGGFFIHPMGESFRLHDFLHGIDPPYLSAEYFARVRVAVECARDHGLYAWLYDEGGWPSGNAQGHVVAGHERFARKYLRARRLRAAGLDEVPEGTVAAVGIPDMGIPEPLELRDIERGLKPYDQVILFELESDPSFVDILNPAAVARFVEVTHEAYAATVGEFFGDTIPGMFTDETPLGGRAGGPVVPWTRELLGTLTARLGRDPRAYLPLLFSPAAVGVDVMQRYAEHERVATRCEYYEAVTTLFRDAYWRPITRWCQEHKLLHTGHVGGEDNLPDHASFGHWYRTAAELDVPGVDVIWGQLNPGEDNFPFPRFASTVVHRRPPATGNDFAGAVLTETNAVYGYGFEYGQMRWLADYQFQGGVSLFGPMASYYTTAGGRLYGTMSHFGPGHPLWPDYGQFAAYAGRQCLLAREAREEPRVAVYYPIECVWPHDGAEEHAWRSLKTLAALLGESQVAFDFLDADALATATCAPRQLQVGAASYRLAVVPQAPVLPAAAAQALARAAAAGVRVVFHDSLPLQAAELDGQGALATALRELRELDVPVASLAQLETHLEPYHGGQGPLRLTDPAPDLLLSARRLDDGWVYLATNNSAAVLECTFTLRAPETTTVEVWDLKDGESTAVLTGGPEACELPLVLPPWSSEALVTRPATADERPGCPLLEAPERSLGHWLATPVADRPDRPPHADVVAVLTHADAARVVAQSRVVAGSLQWVTEPPTLPILAGSPVPLGLWDQWADLQDFSGRIEYRFTLTLGAELTSQPLLLDLGEVYWAASVSLNGAPLATTLWPPHTVDLTGVVQPGDNDLRVTVASTLAAAVCAPDTVAEAQENGWLNVYWPRALPMMQDRRSGLGGPLRVLMISPRAE